MFTYLKLTNFVGIGIVVPVYSHAIFLTPNRKRDHKLNVRFLDKFLDKSI